MNAGKDILEMIGFRELTKDLPRFKDGRVDYTDAKKALVLNCFVKYQDRVLLLKRSDEVLAYKGKWNSIGGFLDEEKPIKEKILEEIADELGILMEDIAEIKVNEPYEFYDADLGRTWVIFPSRAELKRKPKIKLNWEHTAYAWIHPEELKEYDIIPKLEIALENALK